MRKGKGKNSRLLPNSLRIISSCIKTVSTNASTTVRSAGASVAASISSAGEDRKEQVLWAGFDKLELSPTASRRVLLLGYLKGFQVFDVEDASGISELVSKRDGPVSFLQMVPSPQNHHGGKEFKLSHPILAVVGGDEEERITGLQSTIQGPIRYGSVDSSFEISLDPPTTVRFYSLKSNEYVKVIGFKSSVFMVRCSPRVIAIGLEEQIYCFDILTLEKKFVVVTFPIPRVREQGVFGISTCYGPMAVGPRWLAYPANRPFMLSNHQVSPKSFASGVSPSASSGSGTLMARYAVESGKHLATGILNLGDMGYKKLSKYYPELIPDGSSSPGWKSGKLAAPDLEYAGLIVVKDLVSLEVISQFRAHTSPISALCFDPSGTLLVTASIHGNHINIFQIRPSHTCSGSGCSDWSASYVHLYSLHRGLTTAVIQDISFSYDSRWIAIVSSRGTCHIFVLSSLGENDCFQDPNAHWQDTLKFLASTPPWLPTSSFNTKEHNYSSPPPCTLSAIIRIRCNDSGLLSSVSNAAASVVGKTWVPSGAVAAIFHNSNSNGSVDINSSGTALKHVLVYTPSGFVVQHEIQIPMGFEPSESKSESWSNLQVNTQNEESGLKVEPIQWWDVCRRLDNLEREECISGITFGGQHDSESNENSRMIVPENVCAVEKKLVKIKLPKSPERSQWYLSNAEVQISSYSNITWQNSKIHFYVMEPRRAESYFGGELEIETASSLEVEIRHKDLLPVFDHFPRARSGWVERYTLPGRRYLNASPDNYQIKEKTDEASSICFSSPPSFSSTESSEGGSSRRIDNLFEMDHMNVDRSPLHPSHSPSDLNPEREGSISLRGFSMDERSSQIMPFTNVHAKSSVNYVFDKTTMNRLCSSSYEFPSEKVDNTDSASSMPSMAEKTVDFVQFFKEGYFNKPEFQDHPKPNEVVTDEVETNCKTEQKTYEEGWIGGMFDFSEEGMILKQQCK